MIKVTKEKFYSVIGPLDVVLSVKGRYPYTTIFQTRYGVEKGRCVGHGTFEEDEYFLNAPAENAEAGSTSANMAGAKCPQLALDL